MAEGGCNMARNISCSLCGKEAADAFCVCTELPFIGPSCWAPHKAKEGFHFALPLAAKPHVTPDNQKQFKLWLLSLTDSQDKLRANLSAVDRCFADIQAGYDGLIQDILRAKDLVLGKVTEFRAALAASIEQAVKETSLNAYRQDYQPSTYLAQLVWSHCWTNSSKPLQAFTYEIKSTDERLRDPLEVSIQTAIPGLELVSHMSGGSLLVGQLQDLQSRLLQGPDSSNDVQRLTAEISQLKDEGVALRKETAEWKDRCQRLQAEVQKLTQASHEAAPLDSQVSAKKEAVPLESAAVEEVKKRHEVCPPEPLLVHVDSTSLKRFNFLTLKWDASVSLRSPIQASISSRWVVLEDKTIFCCGGSTEEGERQLEQAYVLGWDGAVDTLPAMRTARRCHGIVAVQRTVYVFGGWDNGSLKACEKFSLDQRTWQPLPDMQETRYDFNPCQLQQIIYACGKPSELMEALSLRTERFSTLSVSVPDNCADGHVLYVEGDLLVVHSSRHICKYAVEANGQLIQRSQQGPHTSIYKPQDSQPVVDPARRLFFITYLGSVKIFGMDTGLVSK